MIIEHEDNPRWTAPTAPLNTPSGAIDLIEDMLRRYPDISSEELARCIAFLTKAPILERGSLSARAGMAEKMEQVRRDHPGPFRPSLIGYAVAAALTVLVVLVCIMIAG